MSAEAPQRQVLIGDSRGDHISICPLGRLHRDADDYWDANWLISPVSIVVGAFSATVAATLRTDELRSFRIAVERLSDTLQGETVLESMEEWLALVLRMGSRGQVTVTGRVIDQLGGRNQLTFVIDDLDQTYLPGIVAGLREIEVVYPVIGTP